MVKSQIIQIITENLLPYLTADDVCVYPSNGLIKYVANLENYSIEISYEFIDNLYRVKVEEQKNNQTGHILLLSKSKNFHRDIANALREKGFPKKDYKSHITCLSKIIRKQLDNGNSLEDFKIKYPPDLKYDGIFL